MFMFLSLLHSSEFAMRARARRSGLLLGRMDVCMYELYTAAILDNTARPEATQVASAGSESVRHERDSAILMSG